MTHNPQHLPHPDRLPGALLPETPEDLDMKCCQQASGGV